MVGHGNVTTFFFASHSARTFLKHDHPRPFRWAWCRFPISRPRCKMSVQGVRKAPEELTNVRQLHILMSCKVLGYLENNIHHDHVQKNEDSSSNRTSPSPGPWITSLLTVSLYRCATSPRLSSISGSSGINAQGFGGSPPSWSAGFSDTNGLTHGEQRLPCCTNMKLHNAVELLDCL